MKQRKIIFDIPEKINTIQPVIYVNGYFESKSFLMGFNFPGEVDEPHQIYKNYHWAKNLGIHFRYLQNENDMKVMNFPYIAVPEEFSEITITLCEWDTKNNISLDACFGRVLLFANEGNEPMAIFPRANEREEQ